LLLRRKRHSAPHTKLQDVNDNVREWTEKSTLKVEVCAAAMAQCHPAAAVAAHIEDVVRVTAACVVVNS
jgi:hypothetical protein